MEQVQVLYIGGTMRSGSTILGRLLGELPDAVHVGEPEHLTRAQAPSEIRCECRETLGGCPFWQAVFMQAFGTLPAAMQAALPATRADYRLRTLPRLLLPRPAAEAAQLEAYLAALGALYTAIRDVSGASVIIDGSKDPVYAYLLSRVPGIDLRIVHLVRDSRAVAFSQQRIKKEPALFSNPGQLGRFPPWQTALQWNAVTAFLGAMRRPRPLLLRYEDVVADPAAAVERVWALTGRPTPPLEFLDSPTLSLTPGHSAAGNPDRFQSKVRIQPDLEWQTKMLRRDKNIVTALTLPLLLRYGYLSPRPAPKPETHPARVL